MNKSLEYIKNSISVGQPIVQIISYEEKRVESQLKTLAEQLNRPNIMYWDLNNGLIKDNQRIQDTKEPVRAFNYILKAKNNNKIVNFIISDACNLPFKKNVFNYVLISEVLEHIINWKKALKELYAISNNIIITVPISNIWTEVTSFIKGDHPSFDKPGRGHIHCFRYKELINYIEHIGFKIKKVKGITWFPVYEMARFRFPNLLLILINFIDNIYLTRNIYILVV